MIQVLIPVPMVEYLLDDLYQSTGEYHQVKTRASSITDGYVVVLLTRKQRNILFKRVASTHYKREEERRAQRAASTPDRQNP